MIRARGKEPTQKVLFNAHPEDTLTLAPIHFTAASLEAAQIQPFEVTSKASVSA